MRVVIFFGHHKVGSSSIQHYFGRNAPALAAKGVLYPAVRARDADRLKRHLSAGIATQPAPLHVREAHNALGFSMIADHKGESRPAACSNLPSTTNMFETIRSQIRTLRPHTLVLVSEVFSNFSAIHPPMIHDLIDGLGVSAKDVLPIGIFRRNDDYLVAWHGQRIRFGHKIPHVHQLLDHYFEGIHFDYRRLIEPWRALAPERLTIAPYKPGQSLTLFCDLAKIKMLSEIHSEPKKNPSLHPALLDIARQAQFILPAKSANTCTRKLISLGRLPIWKPAGQVELWGQEARDRIYVQYLRQASYLDSLIGHSFFPTQNHIVTTRSIAQQDATEHAASWLRWLGQLIAQADIKKFLHSYQFETNY